jgi:hypothetical protein
MHIPSPKDLYNLRASKKDENKQDTDLQIAINCIIKANEQNETPYILPKQP